MQRRWLSAALFGGAFVICLIVLAKAVLEVLIVYYSFAFGEFKPDPADQPFGVIIGALAAAIVVYLGSLVDTFFAVLRQARSEATALLAEQTRGSWGDDEVSGERSTPRQ